MAAPGNKQESTFASTLTDLMTSLAIIFILLTVVFLKQAHDQTRKAKEEIKMHLDALMQQKNLMLKQDETDPLVLTMRVGEAMLRFPYASGGLTTQGGLYIDRMFKDIATKICGGALRDKVDSILIEGHTDTSGERTPEGVRQNIALSQKRSYSVLERALMSVRSDKNTYECLLKLASASGRGSQNPVNTDGVYDAGKSRRVEIKFRVKSAEQQFKKQFDPGTRSSS
ncbi:MAG: hypothetical protein A2583_00990 [Bdellovibrionales bacterium RIFOXYD1_FULL_53_11]|nr:MAG: hypothetical protein A2583_00990 [Bdellovibrionales bacterium RIFOXYD1_FULL_53_11]